MLTASTDGLPTITVAQLLSRLTGRIRAAPATAPPTLLRRVACSELADPAPFLLGGELLLTARTPITPGDAAGIRDYVDRLLTGSGPRVVVDLADENGLAALAHPARTVDGTSIGALFVGHRPRGRAGLCT